MNFLVRNVQRRDLQELCKLASQLVLFNLPSEQGRLEEKIELSEKSFAKQITDERRCFLFVCEEVSTKKIIGCSQIKPQQGTVSNPSYSFRVMEKEFESSLLQKKIKHQVLRFTERTECVTEMGGLVVDKGYRKKPEKLGRMVSFSRFLYMANHLDEFTKTLQVELAPLLREDGGSDFWSALGERFTGLSYQEADVLSGESKKFISELFPQDDIYLSLLGEKAQAVLGRVSSQTEPALRLVQKMGFQYIGEVDPFDAGPHLRCPTEDLFLIKEAREREVAATMGREKGGDQGHRGRVGEC